MSTQETLQAACDLLKERGRKVSFEYPGYIALGGLAFGDAGGEAYGWNREDGKEPHPSTEPSLGFGATAEDVAGWIFRVEREQKELSRVYSVLPAYAGTQTYPVAYRCYDSGPGECHAIVADFNGDGGAGDEGSRTARRFVRAMNERSALLAIAYAAERHLKHTWDGEHPCSAELQRALDEWKGGSK